MKDFEKQLNKHKIKTTDDFIKSLSQRRIILITDKTRKEDNKYHVFPYCENVQLKYFKEKVKINEEKNGSYFSFKDEKELEKYKKHLERINDETIRQCELCSKKRKKKEEEEKNKEPVLYFVENINSTEFENDDGEKVKEVALYKMPEEKSDIEKKDDNYENFEVLEILKPVVEIINEGKYYYLHKIKDIVVFIPAGNDPLARCELGRNNNFIALRTPEPEIEDEIYEDCEVCSYHINVGHGNCSIIVLKNGKQLKVWMVDCGAYDFVLKKAYFKNIEKCIENIRGKFNIKDFTINKFFLTHPHFDHYSGINYILSEKNNYINSKTTIYLNQDYSWPSKTYNDTLEKLRKTAPIININKIINKPKYNLPCLEILYPEKTIIREKTDRHQKADVIVEKKPNNTSLQLLFSFNEKTILFTGDLEKKGLNQIKKCQGKINQLNYYCISHHGSANGYERTKCPCNGITINSIADCTDLKKTRCILMGRNHAFNGIYDMNVINDLTPIYSEHDFKGRDIKFVEIDWQIHKPGDIKYVY